MEFEDRLRIIQDEINRLSELSSMGKAVLIQANKFKNNCENISNGLLNVKQAMGSDSASKGLTTEIQEIADHYRSISKKGNEHYASIAAKMIVLSNKRIQLLKQNMLDLIHVREEIQIQKRKSELEI